METTPAQSRKAIFTFLLTTFALSSIFYFCIIRTGKLESGYGIYVYGLMWCPGIAALITSGILKRKISAIAWRWGDTRYELWSFFLPFIYTTIAYVIIWTVGWGGFYNKDLVARIAQAFGWGNLPAALVIIMYIVLTALFGIIQNVAAALGEEIGWRGFLAPELFKITTYTKTSLITGVIWACWHYPILLFADYNSGTPWWYGLTCFTVMVIADSFIMIWFRMKSGSLWTAVILHASHNLFIQSVFTPLTKDTGHTKWYIDEFGVVLAVIHVIFAIYFWTRRGELNKPGQIVTPGTT